MCVNSVDTVFPIKISRIYKTTRRDRAAKKWQVRVLLRSDQLLPGLLNPLQHELFKSVPLSGFKA
jgi:hypothetical protein